MRRFLCILEHLNETYLVHFGASQRDVSCAFWSISMRRFLCILEHLNETFLVYFGASQ